jgi:acid phosphatase type 7
MNPRFVLALGDLVYPEGSRRNFRRYYIPTWGSFKARTRPTPGNHDLRPGTGRPPFYFRYFANQLPNVHRGRYYAFNVGRWRLYSLNCEIACGPRSRQVRWLRRDLATAGRGRHKLAYVHRPRYSCGKRGSSRRLNALWHRLLDARTDLVLAGHSHNYQRFPRMNAHNKVTRRGMLSFVVGTGGVRPFPVTGHERKEGCAKVRHVEGHRAGVLELSLGAEQFRWALVAGNNEVLDAGVRPTLRQRPAASPARQ